MSNNIVRFPTPLDTKQTLSQPTYTYNMSVTINGVDLGDLTDSIWQYDVNDAVKDIRKNKLKQEMDELYNLVEDHPESMEFVLAAVIRLKSQF